MSDSKPPIHAVIGVRYTRAETFYVKRSDMIENYPGVWSLPSIQFSPKPQLDMLDMKQVQPHFDQLSLQRFGSIKIGLSRFLTAGNCAQNPMQRRVFLYLYEIQLDEEPILNPGFYVDAAWLTPEEYRVRAANATCGLCLQLWSDYCFKNGLSTNRFAPEPKEREELMTQVAFKRGDRVRMRKTLKQKLIANGSRAHLEEFGEAIGVVDGPVAWSSETIGPELDVRWLPDRLRYAYQPEDLILEGDDEG